MARKPQPKPAFFEHYGPFTEALENYAVKAGLLFVAVESFLSVNDHAGNEIPGADILKKALRDYKEAANGNPDDRPNLG